MSTWRTPVAAAALLLSMGLASLDAYALALGRVNVQSALGEPLRAEIDVPDINADEAASLKAAVAGPDAFKAAGLEYSAALNNVQISLQKRPDGRSYLRLSSDRPITEPFVDLILEASWASGRMVRDYTMLFDPPNIRAQTPVSPVTAPSVASAAPRATVTARPVPSTAAPVYITEAPAQPAQRGSAPPQRTIRTPKAERVEAPIPILGEIVVKKGNTAAQLAGRYKPAGVSLDQMLVAMLNTNPDAFVNGNVNRLKAGVVLDIPSAVANAGSNSRSDARQMIVAQSKDFNEFRRRLAQGAPSTAAPTASRKASGSVQAKVEERKTNATAPDKLTLSKGAASAAKGVKEESIAKDKQAKDAAVRTAELAKNLQDLTKLGTTTTATAKPATAAASAAAGVALATGSALGMPAPASSSAATKAAVTTASPALASASSAATAVTTQPAASANVVAPKSPASAGAVASSVSGAATKSSTVTAATVAPVPQAPASIAKAPSAAPTLPVAEPSLVDNLLSNPVTLPAAGGLLALLTGFGAYRWRQRKKADQKDSSFLESRLQPDSFFGASGGQRIDTNNTAAGSSVATGSSSMVYSPSQLDAAGDVDPVAEADVYLAYGRDLQAEEILKEALRMQPTRVAVHAKLLEIYAKRRDTKAFENVAKEAYKITNGQGPEWDTARTLGREIDPSNHLYQGVSDASRAASRSAKAGTSAAVGAAAVAAAAVSTVSMATRPASAAAAAAVVEPDVDFDLDLDFSTDDQSHGSSTTATAPDPYLATMPAGRATPATAAHHPHFNPTPTVDEHHTTAMELRSEIDDPFDMAFDAPALPVITSSRDAVKLSGQDMDSFANSLSFSAKPPVKTPTISTTPMEMNTNAAASANALEFDFGDLSLDLKTPSASAMSASVAVDAGITGDPLETKLALAQEFREIGDDDGARSLAQEVATEATGALKARAQRMVADLS
ncbi:MAG: FimV/HubP family polar landmark protein [Burkholderiaceae bacterium]